MSGKDRFIPFAVVAFVLLSACGPSTVTQSLLSSDQTLSHTIEVETTRGTGDKFGSVLVEVDQPNLALQANITRYAGRKLNGLKGSIAAEKLLSPYAERVAFTMSEKDGPNCWHTSIASIFAKWTKSRYMHDAEFGCHVETWFQEVKDPKFGDLIRFLDEAGNELHGATFIGVDKQSQEAVVFTKNGYSMMQGWGFMTFADLKEVYSAVNSVKFYTPMVVALEPAQPGMECYQQYLESAAYQKSMETRSYKEPMGGRMPSPHIY